jgi:hypothetical protein
VNAKKKARDAVDPRLIPFYDAIAELLVATVMREEAEACAAADTAKTVKPHEGERAPRSRRLRGKRVVLDLAAAEVERLESGASLTSADRRRLARLLKFLAAFHFRAVTAAAAAKRGVRPAHRPAGQTPTAGDAEVVAYLVDECGVSEPTAIRAVDPEAALDRGAAGRLRKAYVRYRERVAAGVPFAEIEDRPRRLREWVASRRPKVRT